MKCNIQKRTLAITTFLASMPLYAQSKQGIGFIAENIVPHLSFVAALVKITFIAMGLGFISYSYTLWTASRKNPLFIPRYRVFGGLFLALVCFLAAFQESEGLEQSVSLKPTPIITKKSNTSSNQPSEKSHKHWAYPKSTQNSN